MIRAFDLSLWSEIRLGIFFGGVTSGDENTQAVAEVVPQVTAADRICFGIKNSSTLDLPGLTGGRFLGVSNQTGQQSQCNINEFYSNTPVGFNGVALYDTTILGSGGVILPGLNFPTVTGSSTYCGAFVVQLVLHDRGLSSQNVDVNAYTDSSIAGTDYSVSALRTVMNGASFGSPSNVAWNDGSVAYDLPDAFFLRLPFYNNRIRVSAMRIQRYS